MDVRAFGRNARGKTALVRKGLRGAKTDCGCDRCGTKAMADGQGILPEAWMVIRREVFTNKGPKSLEIQDLCESCTTLHDLFMRELKK